MDALNFDSKDEVFAAAIRFVEEKAIYTSAKPTAARSGALPFPWYRTKFLGEVSANSLDILASDSNKQGLMRRKYAFSD